MSGGGTRAVIDRYIKTLEDRDFDAQATLEHPDVVFEWPQSGERIRGSANWRAIHQNYPGGLPRPNLQRVTGSEDQWVVTPTYMPIRVTGTGDVFTVEGKAEYPNGDVWYSAFIIELRAGKVARTTWYFAPVLEAPAWRSQWVERTTPG